MRGGGSPMGRAWSGDGPNFAIEWGGREWSLRTDADRPGLYQGDRGPVLALAGLTARGRTDSRALSGATLVQSERHLDRIEATYRPPCWGELTIRAAWFSRADNGVDLEVEVSARSVGELRAVEALVASAGPASDPRRVRMVCARDRHCAGLSYDGREVDLHELKTSTLPRPGETWACWGWSRGGPLLDESRALLVMGRPEDVSRRIVGASGSTVHALFGHDLERGVVLRGRVRALWVEGPSEADVYGDAGGFARVPFEEFCAEPPPLTT